MGLHEPYSSLIQDSCKWTNKDQTDRIAVARGSRRGREWAQTPAAKIRWRILEARQNSHSHSQPCRCDRGALSIAPICLVFIGYRAVSLRYPFVGGSIEPPLRMLFQGGNAQKRERGYCTQLAMLRHQKPHSAQ